ncbi:hypothetical protein B0A75_04575 [Flavobacterium oncorhynchi]|uniref:Uncharacterized protein n=1 Tax=Flavobacterium oncorhynchi TaxID=728056 RepID=A0A226I5D2_9FLAO|nr:hypothetical protein [Flavobacterium oncorhynchi]OXB01720.1 hypothetical protein B0A75_04575 [Flavobacterium oncorhynchi]
METLQINKKDAIKAHDEAGPKSKLLLENLLGKAVFLKSIKERIKNFDDVLSELKIKRSDFDLSNHGLESDEVAYRKAKLVAKVFNEGWIPDWANSSEYKYFPYFTMGSPSGVGFSYNYYVYWDTLSDVGSRLAFKSSDLAEYAGKLFEEEIYKPLFVLEVA